ncbi:MAG: MmgE/PrpD family protein [Bifidobacteriaceae bacterium]|jgi:2-methylcitrate dehydratase|nr:MmgE/PrpD family protein [Bifidobacteriaceae bacterium]
MTATATTPRTPASQPVHRTQIQRLADYALRATYADLSEASLEQIPIHILDSVGCALGALGAKPVDACRAHVQQMGGEGVPLIGGGTANPVMGAFWHTALVRYVDAMDNFLAPTETCHTADNFGSILTAGHMADSSGEELMLGVAIGWTAQSRLVDHADFMERGLDHTAELAFSIGAAAGRLLGLDSATIANAIAMAGASDAAFAAIRSKPLSQWKGFASAQSALGAFNTLLLAKRGLKGPIDLIEEPFGVDALLGMKINVDWEHEGYEGVATATIKKFVAMIHTQSAIECMVELTAAHPIKATDVASIVVDVPQITYDFAGGGKYGNASVGIDSKAQADHSLPYLMAVALIDGTVMKAQFTRQRINAPDVQGLLAKVQVRPNADFTRRYPAEFPARVVVKLTDGRTLSHQVSSYPGMPSHPFTWDDAVAKFDALTAGTVSAEQGARIKGAIQRLPATSARELLAELAQVPYPSS